MAKVHSSIAHDSARGHVTGAARYVDDIAEPPGLLHLAFGLSPVAHGRVVGMDLGAVRAAPGVVLVLTADDIPGHNGIGPVVDDEPLLASGEVIFHGQPLFIVAATSHMAARRAARLAKVDITPLPALLTIAEARAAHSLIEPAQTMRRGEPEAALAGAAHRIAGQFAMGGQEHFYLEGQISLAIPGDDGTVHVHCSTQHPSEVQHLVAHLLGVQSADVTVEVRRMGGAFGG